jgi:hypothetical protein
MSSEAQTFLGYAAVIIPGVILYTFVSGLFTGLMPLLGLFVVLHFANNIGRG